MKAALGRRRPFRRAFFLRPLVLRFALRALPRRALLLRLPLRAFALRLPFRALRLVARRRVLLLRRGLLLRLVARRRVLFFFRRGLALRDFDLRLLFAMCASLSSRAASPPPSAPGSFASGECVARNPAVSTRGARSLSVSVTGDHVPPKCTSRNPSSHVPHSQSRGAHASVPNYARAEIHVKRSLRKILCQPPEEYPCRSVKNRMR